MMTPFMPGKRGLPLAVEALIATQRWLYAEANALERIFGYQMELAKRMNGKAAYISDVLGLMQDDAQGIAARSDETNEDLAQPGGQEPGGEAMRPNSSPQQHQER